MVESTGELLGQALVYLIVILVIALIWDWRRKRMKVKE